MVGLKNLDAINIPLGQYTLSVMLLPRQKTTPEYEYSPNRSWWNSKSAL